MADATRDMVDCCPAGGFGSGFRVARPKQRIIKILLRSQVPDIIATPGTAILSDRLHWCRRQGLGHSVKARRLESHAESNPRLDVVL
jgi:hypothetical protein